MKKADDEFAGNGVGVWRRLRYIGGDRTSGGGLDPLLPGGVDAREEKLPEFSLVVPRIEPIKGLGLVGIGNGSENRPFRGPDIIHLQLVCTAAQNAGGDKV